MQALRKNVSSLRLLARQRACSLRARLAQLRRQRTRDPETDMPSRRLDGRSDEDEESEARKVEQVRNACGMPMSPTLTSTLPPASPPHV